MIGDNEALIIDLPVMDITVDHDPDGLPKTVPVEQPREKKTAPAPKDDDAIKQVKRERDEALAARAREVADANARAEAAEKARDDAEGKAGQSKDIASRAYWDKLHGEYAQIESSIQTYKTLADTAKSHLRQVELARAKGEGDPEKLADAAVDAQERLAEAKAALLTLEQGKLGAADEIKRTRAALEAEAQGKKDVKPEVKEKVEPKTEVKKQPTADEWINQWPKRTTGNWLKENRAYVDDPGKHQELMDFINKEFLPEYGVNNLHTATFIDALNEKFGSTESESEEPEMEEEEAPAPVAKEPVKKKVVAAAPVGRNGGYYSSKSPNNPKVWMRPQLVQAAKDIGEDPKKYVEMVKEGIQRGKFPKDYLDPDFDYEAWNSRRS